jgi:hypothetical protein
VLATEHRRYGCPRLHAMLRREGLVVNHKLSMPPEFSSEPPK